MPRNNLDETRSQWEQGPRPPWITRLAGGQSPASSGAESDTESSSTESEVRTKLTGAGSVRVFPSSSLIQQRITDIDQRKEELRIQLQLEIALLTGELQTERQQLERQRKTLEEQHKKPSVPPRPTERDRLEEERRRVEELRRRWEEKEEVVSGQPESQKERLTLQQEKEAMEAAVRAFEDWEFSILESESRLEEEEEEVEEEEADEEEEDAGGDLSVQQQQAISYGQEHVHHLERQLKEVEREKERELNALRREKRDLLHATQMMLKEKKPLADWSNITGSAPCMISLSPMANNKQTKEPCQEFSSLPRRRHPHGNHLHDKHHNERPLSAQGFIRSRPDQSPGFTSSSLRLTKGNRVSQRSSFSSRSVGVLNANGSSRIASQSPGLGDLLEMERRLQAARAERERLLRERQVQRRLVVGEVKEEEEEEEEEEEQAERRRRQKEHSSPRTDIIHLPDKPHPQSPAPSSSSPASPEIPTNQITSDQSHVPLFLAVNFDLRVHVESLGHGVSGCPGLRISGRRCAGFLTKRGGRVKTWKRRWFLFDMDHRRLAYYTDHDERKLKGVIYFQAIEEVYYDHLRTSSSPRPSLTFCVKTYERLFFLVALSPEAMRIWMDVIVTATDEHSRY
ncbi:pleckstrin homology-like domain family B member 3 isoform X1 [Gadus morhua]|uniref:pleckstrin homology-like domain family B member 3 isoform X1 n=1 Tax=Gadus morhua TaxID=8049 RepID=UPI0011B6337B|nr:pleckstrin homology-like domain family B member 3 isoform X1 [Gadus morhua]